MANGGGGMIYIGVGHGRSQNDPWRADRREPRAKELLADIKRQIEPVPDASAVVIDYDGKSIISLSVAAGTDVPYELKGDGILVRPGNETRGPTAMRSSRSSAAARSKHRSRPGQRPSKRRSRSRRCIQRTNQNPPRVPMPAFAVQERPAGYTPNGAASRPALPEAAAPHWDPQAPHNGVEIVAAREHNGDATYDLRDLRNGAITEDVPRDTTRKIWRYAIQQREQRTVDQGHIRWNGDFGFWKVYRPHRGEKRYNLALRNGNDVRLFYGVGEDGLTDEWREVIPPPKMPAHEDAAPESE